MKNNVLHTAVKLTALVATGAMILLCGPTAPAAARDRTSSVSAANAQEQILLDFTRTDKFGLDSASGLIQDAEGNLYGTTEKDGQGEGGTVFELSPKSGGGWTAQVLYDFQRYGVNGSAPVAGLVFDAAGNLYGTTENGGIGSGLCATGGCGTVFELSPQLGGGWTEKVLPSFQNAGSDGFAPMARLIFDDAGNLYGTAELGGTGGGDCSGGCGIVFELSPQSGGSWTEKVLYDFTGGADGGNPLSELVRDASGILYGTASVGGTATCITNGCGTVFELKQKPGGSWIEKTLHDFQGTGTDGGNPVGGLTFDGAGNLYGTTSDGGSTGICNQYGCGTVFKLSPKSGGGGWREKILYSFQGYPTDGSGPTASLIFNTAGNLFGTTEGGGSHTCAKASTCGTVFELSPQSGKAWAETVLYDFGGPFYDDGDFPFGGVILDSAGNLYGTTTYGGTCAEDPGCGTVFKITP